MTAFDYSGLLAISQSLVAKFGRPVTLIRYDQTVGDAAKPWDGPTDARAVPNLSVAAVGAFVPVYGRRALGLLRVDDDSLKRVMNVLLVAPPVGSTDDLTTVNAVIDGGVEYELLQAEVLRPATTVLLYAYEVKR